MKIAGVQFDVQLGQVTENLQRMIEFSRQTSEHGARLTVFPECCLTGYCFSSIDEARPFAQPLPGPATATLQEVCAERNSFVVFGMLEAVDTLLFNAAVLVGPRGVVGSYRKIHLPYLGIDKYCTHGDRPFTVHAADDLKIGMNICYDASFPEAARTLTLQGADLVALPTNWPPGADCVAETTIRCRALENGIYFIAVNRIGSERGFRFIGQSQICDPGGRQLHLASEDREEIFYADIDVAFARRKHVIRVPGEHEIHRLADRRPEMYHALITPHNLKSPGR
jgi:predicted amidohydrolase